MMGLRDWFGRVYEFLTAFGGIRYDSNGIHRSWEYDPDESDEVTAVQQFAGYAEGHNIPQSYLDVWTQNGCINYNIRRFMFDPLHERFTHYLVYPDWVHSSNSSDTSWSMSFETANEIDPGYHMHCAPYLFLGVCDYCEGVNSENIG